MSFSDLTTLIWLKAVELFRGSKGPPPFLSGDSLMQISAA
jgi:hypothetical protein